MAGRRIRETFTRVGLNGADGAHATGGIGGSSKNTSAACGCGGPVGVLIWAKGELGTSGTGRRSGGDEPGLRPLRTHDEGAGEDRFGTPGTEDVPPGLEGLDLPLGHAAAVLA
jgi:hypothetical protein